MNEQEKENAIFFFGNVLANVKATKLNLLMSTHSENKAKDVHFSYEKTQFNRVGKQNKL